MHNSRSELVRWVACGVVVLFAHAGLAAAVIEWHDPVEAGEVGTDAIVVEFQPEQIQTDPIPDPVEVEEKPEPLPEQPSEAMLLPQPDPQPEPPHEDVPAVAPRPVQARAVLMTWRNQIVTLLERNKRYPSDARARGEHGIARLAFSIDAAGHLIASRIVASSGSAALDQETLALVRRAQPFPPPPPELAGAEMLIPVSFSIR
jgi:protein TonB